MARQVNKLLIAVGVGFSSAALMLPVTQFFAWLLGGLRGCAGGWFCGIEGLFIAPLVIVALSILTLKPLKLNRPILLGAIGGTLQIIGWALAVMLIAGSGPSRMAVPLIFAFFNGLMYGIVFLLMARAEKPRR